jgi:hypothetical protein
MPLDKLIERFGPDAIVIVSPYVIETGETLRWFAQINGEEVNELDVHLREDGDLRVLILVVGAEDEIELLRWDLALPNAAVREPAGLTYTLRELKEKATAMPWRGSR